jgi:hypothetical protein
MIGYIVNYRRCLESLTKYLLISSFDLLFRETLFSSILLFNFLISLCESDGRDLLFIGNILTSVRYTSKYYFYVIDQNSHL